MAKSKKQVTVVEDIPIKNDINANIRRIRQLKCSIDGSDIKMKEIKKAIENEEIDELWIFGISNRLLREINDYLKESNIKHVVYGRSRISIYYK